MRNLQIAARIPHQSQIGFYEPICDSFPPGEALGASAPAPKNHFPRPNTPNNIAIESHLCYIFKVKSKLCTYAK